MTGCQHDFFHGSTEGPLPVGGQGSRTAPRPGWAAACAVPSRSAAASRAFWPVCDIRAAIRPATSGVLNDVPLHCASPVNVPVVPMRSGSMYGYEPSGKALIRSTPGANTSTQPPKLLNGASPTPSWFSAPTATDGPNPAG